jgi:uncharacterized protein (DUF362 family)
MIDNPSVSILQNDGLAYPQNPPYHPPQIFSELSFLKSVAPDPLNNVYGTVRDLLIDLGLDKEQIGTPSWNPLRSLIHPGETVVIKPNAVWDLIIKKGETVFASITHGSVIRPIIDYAYKALSGRGRLIVADCPIAHSDFGNWSRLTGMESIASFYRDVHRFRVEVYDCRKLYAPWDFVKAYAPSHLRQYKDRDPAGYVEVDLGPQSEFAPLPERLCRMLYGSDYDRSLTVHHHIEGRHRYCMAKTFLEADLLISVPKLKVHSLVGVTLNLKGFVGTQGDKNYIPHHRVGNVLRRGDEHPDLGLSQNLLNRYRMWLLTTVLSRRTPVVDRLYRMLFPFQRYAQRLLDRWGQFRQGSKYRGNITGGAWYGNDTAWRMALDLSRIVLYSDKEGRLRQAPQRHFFSLVDGVLAGEGQGPLSPTAKPCGVIMGGFNPLAVDIAGARLMGFSPARIRMLREGLQRRWLKTWNGDEDQIKIGTNQPFLRALMTREGHYLNFTPPQGWRGHIEMQESEKDEETPF